MSIDFTANFTVAVVNPQFDVGNDPTDRSDLGFAGPVATGAKTTARLMTVNSLASLVLALVAPLLGAIADRGGWRKSFLTAFAVSGTMATASLYLVPAGDWLAAAILFGVASAGFAGANVFYDAMLVDIADESQFDSVSAFGYALGYIGGGLLLAIHLAMVLAPDWFCLIDGVNTVMKVALDFGYKLGIGQRNLLIALLIVQCISFPAALMFGWLGGKIGPKWGLLIGLSVYIAVTIWAAFMHSLWEFYVLACAAGLVQGGVFSLSRSYYARLIPPAESADFLASIT